MNRFAYLGITLSQNVAIDDEVNTKIAKSTAAFGKLHANAWNRRGIILQNKLKVYRAIVLPTLLYACEMWTVYQRHARKLSLFHTTSLRKPINIKWPIQHPHHTNAVSFTMFIPCMPIVIDLQDGKRSHGGKRNVSKKI